MAAFHVPPFVFFVRCGGEAVFFVCSEDYPEVIYQNVNLLIPTLCGSIIRVFVRIRWKIRDSRAVSRKRNVQVRFLRKVESGAGVFRLSGFTK